jgi:hypothetical protein
MRSIGAAIGIGDASSSQRERMMKNKASEHELAR